MKSKKITEPKKPKENVFEKFSFDWWNLNGKFQALHTYNFVRIDYIKKRLKNSNPSNLKNLRILDVGCGGGILCEPLARLGADVTGIDTNAEAIRVAKEHAKLGNLKINYFNSDLASFNSSKKYDLITAMEVLEHIHDYVPIIKNIKNNLKEKGKFIGSTINQTLSSYLFAILFAEKIIKLVPEKTHTWRDFLKPNNLKKQLLFNNFCNINFQGVIYNPLTKNWKISENCNVNYMFSAELK